MTIFVPLLLLMTLQVSALIMPPRIPDRSGFSVTTILAYQVSLPVFTESIPATSQKVYLFYYIYAHMAVGVAVTIYTLVACSLTRFDKMNITATRLGPFELSFIRVVDCIVTLVSISGILCINFTFMGLVASP